MRFIITYDVITRTRRQFYYWRRVRTRARDFRPDLTTARARLFTGRTRTRLPHLLPNVRTVKWRLPRFHPSRQTTLVTRRLDAVSVVHERTVNAFARIYGNPLWASKPKKPSEARRKDKPAKNQNQNVHNAVCGFVTSFKDRIWRISAVNWIGTCSSRIELLSLEYLRSNNKCLRTWSCLSKLYRLIIFEHIENKIYHNVIIITVYKYKCAL